MKGAEKGKGVRERGRRDFINEEMSFSGCVEAHGPSRGWDVPEQGAVRTYLMEGDRLS